MGGGAIQTEATDYAYKFPLMLFRTRTRRTRHPYSFTFFSSIRIQLIHPLSLGPGHTADTSTDNRGQFLVAHGDELTDAEADQTDEQDGEAGKQPKGHADVLFLTGRTTPLGRLLGAVGVCADVGTAGAAVAGSLGAGVLVRVL